MNQKDSSTASWIDRFLPLADGHCPIICDQNCPQLTKPTTFTVMTLMTTSTKPSSRPLDVFLQYLSNCGSSSRVQLWVHEHQLIKRNDFFPKNEFYVVLAGQASPKLKRLLRTRFQLKCVTVIFYFSIFYFIFSWKPSENCMLFCRLPARLECTKYMTENLIKGTADCSLSLVTQTTYIDIAVYSGETKGTSEGRRCGLWWP